MSDEEMTTEEPKAEEAQTPEVSDWEQRFKDLETKFNAEKSGLMRRNTQLEKVLAEKEKASMTVEERIQALEAEKQKAELRAQAVEAFGKAGLEDEWRQLFDVQDPEARAETLNAMLADYKRRVTQEVATEYGRKPDASLDDSKREYKVSDLKGMSPEQINKLYAEGRVKGA
jgi:hypothetical protein